MRAVNADRHIDELYAAARANDMYAFQHGVLPLWTELEGVGPARAAEVLDRILGLFALVPNPASSKLGILAGSLVAMGAPPAALAEVAAPILLENMAASVAFARFWRRAAGPKVPLPRPDQGQEAYEYAQATLTRNSRLPWRHAVAPQDAAGLAGAWFSLEDWLTLATTLLSIPEIRSSFFGDSAAADPSVATGRDEAAQLVADLGAVRGDMDCVAGLLEVLDDEELIVVHRGAGRAYAVTLTGVGDNFQLCTLLADAFAGEFPELTPEPSWVLASSTGPVDAAARIEARCQLTDALGANIWLEGRPAGIPRADERRVVVLDPVAYGRSWDLGRTYEQMVPKVRVDRELAPQEAARWMAQIAPPAPVKGHPPAHIHFGRLTSTVEVTG
ncbi:hypothetical protein GCM10010435_79930 [Winogradskya consettensis]|uniref:Uncharacterized protein n=1 Tax=Winogradskya consettensis TaxID=113560 RepID=A0A919SRV2_9ACTN|nr:hypothetical protein Aco04nite_55040 [Actinoplanes consettensis]